MTPDATGRRVFWAFLFFFVPVLSGIAFPGNSWKHVASEHFVISYNNRTAHLSKRAVGIAEEIYASLSGYFGLRPMGRKISIVLSDQSDDPNGLTDFRDPWVSVDCRKTQSLFRGETDWLRTVLSHELSHAFSLKVLNKPLVVSTTMGISSSIENFSAEASHYWGMNAVPMWFIEGIAQLGSYHFKADSRDPIREMILRSWALNNALLTVSEMARFEGTSLDYELVYNQGFSFILYLEETYGEAPISELCAAVRSQGLIRALRAVYGKPVEALYLDWKNALAARYANAESWNAGQRIVDRDDLLGIEVRAARSGEFVIANWGHDYARFGLFKRKQDGRYIEISRDAGLVLKEDPGTGEVWFNRSAYNYGTGVDSYDVYRAGRDGWVSRETHGARCLAFDARDGHLVYARYRDGKTDIVQRRPDGSETVVYEVAPDSSVYAVSLISRDLVLLTIGTGDGTRLGILADHRLRYLWEDQQILDAVAAGNNRIVFSSTLSGTPQIYWADLGEDPRVWFQLTGVSGGARFPDIQGGAASRRLSFSVFEKGGFHLYSLDDPFSRDHPVEIAGSTTEEPPAPIDQKPDFWSTRARTNGVIGAPSFSVQVYADRHWDGSEPTMVPLVAIGVDGSIYNAPLNLGLDAEVTIFSYILPNTPLTPDISAWLTGYFDLWQLRSLLQYGIQTESYYLGPGFTFSYALNDLYTESDFQIASRQAIAAFYDFSWLKEFLSGAGLFFVAHTTGLRWWYSDTPRSLFDPANLGQPLVRVYAGGDARFQSFPTAGAFNPSLYSLDPKWSFQLLAGLELRALILGSRLSCDLKVEGFTLPGAVGSDLPTPYLQPSVGGETSFSGYPAGYARVNALAKGALELRASPWVNKRRKTAWYQRFGLGAKLEAGIVQYCSTGWNLGFPLSVEACLRQYFYLSPNRESLVYLKAGVPLVDFLGTITLPLQIYAGYSF
jgi:hypothetical protein